MTGATTGNNEEEIGCTSRNKWTTELHTAPTNATQKPRSSCSPVAPGVPAHVHLDEPQALACGEDESAFHGLSAHGQDVVTNLWKQMYNEFRRRKGVVTFRVPMDRKMYQALFQDFESFHLVKKSGNMHARPTHKELDSLFGPVGGSGPFHAERNRRVWFTKFTGRGTTFVFPYDFRFSFSELGSVSCSPLEAARPFDVDPGGDEAFYVYESHVFSQCKVSFRVCDAHVGDLTFFTEETDFS
jgi:hypothetical protein